MQIIALSKWQKDYDQIMKIWNDAYGIIFPISKELLERNIVNYPGLDHEASFVACIENQVIGFIFAKREQFTWMKEYNTIGWISLFFVKPQYRKNGVGGELLKQCEASLKLSGVKTVHIGRDYHNFFPGLPFDLKSSLPWFEKRGFRGLYDTNDLIRVIDQAPKMPLKQTPYEIREARKEDFASIRKLFVDNWPSRWLEEFDEYVKCGGTGKEFIIALDNEVVCAFCKVVLADAPTELIAYSSTWRQRFTRLAGIGPLGVDAKYRKMQLGYNVVVASINKCIDHKMSHIIIDWTNLIDFYRQFGFEIWKSYKYLVKEEL